MANKATQEHHRQGRPGKKKACASLLLDGGFGVTQTHYANISNEKYIEERLIGNRGERCLHKSRNAGMHLSNSRST